MGKKLLNKPLSTRVISLNNSQIKGIKHKKKKSKKGGPIPVKELVPKSSALFFQYNTQLGPPYHILMDTNFINISLKNKLDIFKGLMDCLYAKVNCYITECVMGEIEKLGNKFRIALRIAKDPRFERITCLHKGIYADDCLVNRVQQHKCYIIATCDKDLKRRIRKIAGVPIIGVANHRFTVEGMPDAFGAPKM
ncbi:unnamed protein product [Gordionus sp. m RMFG-2023]|uniref:rRNA-processing protein FCF1 homolog n=1 Tax=Gordionus sp. m RMFG-2023 TaxID=3053472 RepID=UPI0030E0E563